MRVRGAGPAPRNRAPGTCPPPLAGAYGAVLAALAVEQRVGRLAFPQFWPVSFSLQGWESVGPAPALWVTLAPATASSATARCSGPWPGWNAPRRRRDARLRRLVYLPLLLPSVLWVVGLHRLSLAWGIDARWPGLRLAHSLAAAPHVLIALSPAYQGL